MATIRLKRTIGILSVLTALAVFCVWLKHTMIIAPTATPQKAGRVASEPPRSAVSPLRTIEAAAHKALRAKLGLNENVPMFTADDDFALAHIDGIQFKVYTGPDGSKFYFGPPGTSMLSTLDGTPISASIDEDEAARVEAIIRASDEKLRQRMDAQRTSRRP